MDDPKDSASEAATHLQPADLWPHGAPACDFPRSTVPSLCLVLALAILQGRWSESPLDPLQALQTSNPHSQALGSYRAQRETHICVQMTLDTLLDESS